MESGKDEVLWMQGSRVDAIAKDGLKVCGHGDWCGHFLRVSG